MAESSQPPKPPNRRPLREIPTAVLTEETEHLRLLYRVGISLSAEKNKNRLVEMILLEAKKLCNADGGTLYLLDDQDRLQFDIFMSESLGLIGGGTSGKPIDLPPIPVYDEHGNPNQANIASYTAAFKSRSTSKMPTIRPTSISAARGSSTPATTTALPRF
jgi:hypothetical protein